MSHITPIGKGSIYSDVPVIDQKGLAPEIAAAKATVIINMTGEAADVVDLDSAAKKTAGLLKKEKKKAKKDAVVDSDSDDDEKVEKKQPSKLRTGIVIAAAATGTVAAIFLKAQPIITVGLSGLLGTMSKSVLRRVPIKVRYIGLGVALGGAIAFDTLVYSGLNLSAVVGGLGLSCISRTAKLWTLGKLEKDR